MHHRALEAHQHLGQADRVAVTLGAAAVMRLTFGQLERWQIRKATIMIDC